MADLVVRYFYQTGKDLHTNMAIFPFSEYQLCTVNELISAFLRLKLANLNCHFRFKDQLEGNVVWVDIKNGAAPLPINKSNEVEVKILQMPIQSSFQSLFSVNNIENTYQPQKKIDEPIYVNKQHPQDLKIPFTKLHSGNKYTVLSPKDWDFMDQTQKDKNSQPKKMSFSVDKELDSKQFGAQNIFKTPENLPENNKKSISANRLNEKELEDLFVSDSKKPMKHVFELFKNQDVGPKSRSKTPEKKMNSEFGDMLDLNIGEYVAKNSYTDMKENEALKQRQKIESSSYIDPRVRDWAYKNDIQLDLRTLLTTLHEIMPSNDTVWTKVELADILSEGALRKVTLSAIINLHPDKHQNAEPSKLYLYQRVVEEINKAFQTHKSKNKN